MSRNEYLQKLSEDSYIEKFHQLYGIPGVPIKRINIVHPDFLYKNEWLCCICGSWSYAVYFLKSSDVSSKEE